MNIRNNSKDKDNGKLIGGVILVAVGIGLLFRNMGFFMPYWLFTWPMILILVGVYTGFKHNFRNNSWIVLVGIGGFFLLNDMKPDFGLRPYFWPLIIIGAGLLIILRPRGENIFRHGRNDSTDWKNADGATPEDSLNSGIPDSSNFVKISSVFSGMSRRVLSKDFQGAHVSSVFGGAEINLSQADIKGPVVIKVEIVFGGLKLIVPPHWAIQNEIDGVFHGIEDKRKINVPAELNPDKLIILKGSVVFGGVDIKSY
ncbi:MAG: DUF5668 domain-containing protein [Ferruginibacter sp.]